MEEKANKKQIQVRNIVFAVLCIFFIIFSFFVVTPKMEKAETYKEIVQILDKKRASVVEISGALVGLSVAVAAVPGDATTPIATQVAQLNSYLVMALGAIMLEKFLLPVIGMITWRITIPLSALLYALYFMFDKKILLRAAARILIFAIGFFLLIPSGVLVSNTIDKSFGTDDLLLRLKEDLAEIDTQSEAVEDNTPTETDGGFLDGLINRGKDIVDQAATGGSKILEKAKAVIGETMDAVAALLITSCAIPIGMLFIMLGIIKASFAVFFRSE